MSEMTVGEAPQKVSRRMTVCVSTANDLSLKNWRLLCCPPGLRFLTRLPRERGQDFALVYLPTHYQLAEEPMPEARWLQAFGARSGIPIINLAPQFAALPNHEMLELYLLPNPHYSPKGNRFVAELLRDRLSELFPDFPGDPRRAAGPSRAAAVPQPPPSSGLSR